MSDKNQNTWWNCAYNAGDMCGSVNLDFAKATSVVNTERGSSHDAGYARFQEVEEWKSGNLWSYTDALSKYYDVDVDYHYNRVNDHEGSMDQ